MREKNHQKIVVLATGGTIAGLAADPEHPEHYQAGQVPIETLLAAVTPSGPDALREDGIQIVTEQIAQIDSKDMAPVIWQQLIRRLLHWLAQADVAGVVITHGSDTLEETAYFLQAVLQPAKPVVLTCAMRAANDPDSDGPANLQDALVVAGHAELPGVWAVCGGSVHAGHLVQKIESHSLKPFVSGTVGPTGRLVAGQYQHLRDAPPLARTWPVPSPQQLAEVGEWPRVELVLNHAGANGRNVRDMLAASAPPAGWVVLGTGNGTVHHELAQALQQAQSGGARVVRATRCALGQVVPGPDDGFESAGTLTPVQARLALQLALMCR